MFARCYRNFEPDAIVCLPQTEEAHAAFSSRYETSIVYFGRFTQLSNDHSAPEHENGRGLNKGSSLSARSDFLRALLLCIASRVAIKRAIERGERTLAKQWHASTLQQTRKQWFFAGEELASSRTFRLHAPRHSATERVNLWGRKEWAAWLVKRVASIDLSGRKIVCDTVGCFTIGKVQVSNVWLKASHSTGSLTPVSKRNFTRLSG